MRLSQTFVPSLSRALGLAPLLALLLATNGCSPSVAGVVRPDQPRAVDAMNDTEVVAVNGYGEPLIVDWPLERRADLELAMRDGVAVLAFDKKGMRTLEGCRLGGDYGYAGFIRKEKLVRLENATEIRANLPLTGAALVAQLGAELESGTTVDIALVMVGKMRTTTNRVSEGELTGNCNGATHFVRGAMVGAFALKTGARGKAATVAEIFGVGGRAAAASTKLVSNKDGDLGDCQTASPSSDKPPAQCGALLRLQLSPIARTTATAPTTAPTKDNTPNKTNIPDKVAEREVCPDGLVYADGKCTKRELARSYVCEYGKAKQCESQCAQGNFESCAVLAQMYEFGNGVPRELDQVGVYARKACNGGSDEGCNELAIATYYGWGVRQSYKRAADLFTTACARGVANGCRNLAIMYMNGEGVPKDLDRAAGLSRSSCNAGEAAGCNLIGWYHFAGMGVRRDVSLAGRYFKRACDGNDGIGCGNLAYFEETGMSGRKDLEAAGRHLVKGCLWSHSVCALVAKFKLSHARLPQAIREKTKWDAQTLFDSACADGNVEACAALNLFYQKKTRLDRNLVQRLKNSREQVCYKYEDPASCSTLATVSLALGEDEKARSLIYQSCSKGDAWGCFLRGRVLEQRR